MSVVANVAINVDATKALGQLKAVDQASKGLDGGLKDAADGAKGFGAALQSALGPLVAVSTAVAVVQKSLAVAFERGAAEQRLKNLASSTGEYKAALAAAASTSERFGISQTEATTALADIYNRLKGVGFGLKETTQIYEGFNVIAKQSGITGADAAGVFFQLSQALGKGKLNGDEFVSVSERMPGLLDAIAKQTGRSRGELAGMAQQGQITGDVLYRALAQSAIAAGNLNGKLTDQQKAFNNLSRVADNLLNTIGKVFAPFVIKGAEMLAAVGQKLSEWWDYLGKNVLPRVLQAIQPAVEAFRKLWTQIPWETIIGYIQGAMLVSINRIVAAIEILGPAVGFVVSKFAELAKNPVIRFIAEQVGNLLNMLGYSSDAVSKFTAKQKEAEKAAAGTVNQYSSMPQKIQTAAEANSKLIASTKQVLQNVKEQQIAIDAQISSLERGASVNSARIEAEKAINDLQGQQLERQYGLAQTAQQRLNIAIAIFNNQVKAAQIEYEQALSNIKLEEIKLNLQRQAAELKLKQIDAAGRLAILEAKSVAEETKKKEQLKEALAAQEQVIIGAKDASKAQQEISRYQKQTASAQYESKILAAQTAFESKATSDSIGMSQQGAAELSGKLAASVKEAYALNNQMNGVANNAQRAANAITVVSGKSPTPTSGNFIKAHNASGGYISRPTATMVGEAGGEYIVPESKAANFAANYLSGARGAGTLMGSSSPAINITTGPVMQQNGQNYVTIQDMEAGLQAVADTILSNSRSYSARRFSGVA